MKRDPSGKALQHSDVSTKHCATANDDDKDAEGLTVAEAIDQIGLGSFQINMGLITGLLTFCDALEIMLLAVLAPVLQCEWMLNDYQVALITTVVFVGYLFSAPIWGSFSDYYGRRNIVGAVTIWISVYGTLTAFAPTYIWVLILRGCVGVGLGGAAQSCVLYSEYLPNTWRMHLLVLVSSVSWTIGVTFEIIIAAIILPNVPSDSPIAGWRVLVLVSALPIVLACISLRCLPESSKYLVAAGRRKEAKRLIDEAAKLNKQPELKGSLKADPQQALGDIRDLFRSGLTLTTLGSWTLWFTAAFAYYGMALLSVTLFDLQKRDCNGAFFGESGQPIVTDASCSSCTRPSQEAYISMLVTTLGEFASVGLNFVTLNRLGRKRSMALYLALQGIGFLLLIPCGMPSEVVTALAFIIRGLSSAFFNAVYVYIIEVYPTRVRSLGLGSSSSAARIGALLTPFVAQVLAAQNRMAALAVYGLVSILAAIVSLIMPIETVNQPFA